MKLLLRLLFVMSLLFIFGVMLGCAGISQKDELHQAYVECMNENKVPKVDSRGVVALDKRQNPIFLYNRDACTQENAAYSEAAERRARRLDRKLQMPSCITGQVLYCEGKCTARDMERERCRCSCISTRQLNEMLYGFGHRRY